MIVRAASHGGTMETGGCKLGRMPTTPFLATHCEEEDPINRVLPTPPLFLSISRLQVFQRTFSSLSCAARNLLDLCWFIFARGATPSMAM